MSYLRALSLTVLWGLLFVVVLTMISGARELMTPGAWQKDGWTYQLERNALPQSSIEDQQEAALEKLRFELWQSAATSDGNFPKSEQIEAGRLEIPGRPGLKFLYREGLSAESGEAGRLLAFEPSTDSGERLVLWTNGMIGRMPETQLKQALSASEKGQE